jgi:DNA-binding transcriptional LysR family regulator
MIAERVLLQFIAVAEELHFGRAAVRVHVVQPALSRAIRHLEEQIGVELLSRTKRSVKLTPAGEVFLAEARDLMRQGEHAIHAARRASQGFVGRVAIGFVGSLSYGLLPRILREFRARYPAIEVELFELLSKEQIERLQARKIDVGILRLPLSNTAGLEVRIIDRERFVAVLPEDHRLAKARSVRLADLADERFMIFPADRAPNLHAKFLLACHEVGFSPRVELAAWQLPTMVSLVAAGFGVVLLPSQVRHIPMPGVVYKDLASKSKHIRLEIAAAWRKDNVSPAVKSLLGVISRKHAGAREADLPAPAA